MKNKFLIVTCETNLDFSHYKKNYYIIGVERGCLDLIKKDITIDFAIADFDNVIKEELELIKSSVKAIEILNEQKDELDGTHAIKKAYELGAKEIIFVAKPTSRMDMNLSILEFCYKYKVKVLNDRSVAFCLSVGKNILKFEQYQDYKYITLYPTHETTISISNLHYPVSDLKLLPNSTRAFSNCFKFETDGEVTTSKPILVIFNK